MSNIKLLGAIGLFSGALLISWVTHGTGVVVDDHDRNISIPEQLTVPMQVQAAYNSTTMFMRYRWPAERPGIFHDIVRYEDGKWVREGGDMPGSNPFGMHEDRVAMMLDDGSVPEFGRYGGYITIGDGLAGLTDEAPEEVTKYLPLTRNRLGAWDDMAPESDLMSMRRAGYFIDLWHWRGARSNPIDEADDQNVGSGRDGDAGSSSYTTNWDSDAAQPLVMFDAAATGYRALKWDDVREGLISQDQTYALISDAAVPFDPEAGWEDGDVLPRRIVRPGSGSRGDINADGRWADGYWDVTLSRRLDTGNPMDDKILKDHGTYDVAFAIHRNATGGRWHYVSLPSTLGLAHEADINAARFTGTTPVWGDAWTDVTLFYPGQVTWAMLNSAHHAGASSIAEGIPVEARHSPEQLAVYGVEVEFRDEIRRQWLMTLIAGVALIFAFGFALNATIASRKGA